MILVSDSFGNNTCQSVDLGLRYQLFYLYNMYSLFIIHNLSRGVFDTDPSSDDPDSDVRLGNKITQEIKDGNIKTLKKKICSLHCGRKKNPHKDPQFKCQ